MDSAYYKAIYNSTAHCNAFPVYEGSSKYMSSASIQGIMRPPQIRSRTTETGNLSIF